MGATGILKCPRSPAGAGGGVCGYDFAQKTARVLELEGGSQEEGRS